MSTAAADNKNRGKRYWLRQLQPLLLPVDPRVKTAAIQKLLSPSGNADNVARLLQEDPVLVLRVVHSANKLLASSGNELKSLAHGISLLGTPATEQLLRSAPDYDRQAFPQLDEFRQQLGISLHAATQAAGWADHHRHWADGDLFLATLLQRAPIWALWQQAPEAMLALQQARLHNRGGGHEWLEQQHLGCSIQSLAASAVQQWQLPGATRLSWFPSERGSNRQWILLSRIIPEQAPLALETIPPLQRLVNDSSLAIALANRLAETSHWDWFDRRTLRLQHILAVAMAEPLADAIALTHQLAAAASRLPGCAALPAPAARLLCAYRLTDEQPRRPLQAVERERDEASDSAGEPDRDPLADAPEPLLRLISDLRRRPQLFNDLHELFNQIVSCLCLNVGFERATVSLLNASNQELRTYYSCGCDTSPSLQNYRQQLSSSDLFSKLLSKPLSLRLQADNYPQLWPLLPGTFKQACDCNRFVAMSLFVNRRPLALIYADRGVDGDDISDQHYDWFKQLCNAVSICLTQRTRRKL